MPSVFDAPAAERFAVLVRYSLIGPLMPYSTRQALLRKAGRMGIGRFQANLIIAMVQHEAGGSPLSGPDAPGGISWVWAVVGVVQVLIVVGAYLLLRT